jgi:hypothetical protein
LHWAISVVVIAFLSYLLLSHLFGKLKRNIRLEGFESATDVSGSEATTMGDLSGNEPAATDKLAVSGSAADVDKVAVSGSAADVDKVAVSGSAADSDKLAVSGSTTDVVKVAVSGSAADKPLVTLSSSTSDTDKSTIMADLFENVNKQLDVVRTFKLSDTLVPVKIDKTPQDDVLILANLKLLVNNGVSKNELDLKEVYDKYIGNKAVPVLVSDMNSLNLVRVPDNIADLETTFLSRTKAIVDAHQKIIDKILDNKSKQ